MLRTLCLVGLALLGACDGAVSSPPAASARPPAVTERPSPVRWNPQESAFELAGRPLRAVKLWTFDGSTEGYTAPRSELIPAAAGGLQVSIVDPMVRSPSGLSVNGSNYSLVIVRLTRLKAGGGWNGALYYVTPEHGESGEFFGKPVLGADPKVGETAILVYDMARQTVGGEDWALSLIDQIRIDLEDRPGGQFLIQQIAIAEKADLSTFLPPPLTPPPAS